MARRVNIRKLGLILLVALAIWLLVFVVQVALVKG